MYNLERAVANMTDREKVAYRDNLLVQCGAIYRRLSASVGCLRPVPTPTGNVDKDIDAASDFIEWAQGVMAGPSFRAVVGAGPSTVAPDQGEPPAVSALDGIRAAMARATTPEERGTLARKAREARGHKDLF